eukprot:8375482-Pyramimonas_sp.AAC.1
MVRVCGLLRRSFQSWVQGCGVTVFGFGRSGSGVRVRVTRCSGICRGIIPVLADMVFGPKRASCARGP